LKVWNVFRICGAFKDYLVNLGQVGWVCNIQVLGKPELLPYWMIQWLNKSLRSKRLQRGRELSVGKVKKI
jgi:hypothetical protein